MYLPFDLNELHTTELGAIRMRKALYLLPSDDPIAWCRDAIEQYGINLILREGKNWYITTDRFELTVNASTLNVITARSC